MLVFYFLGINTSFESLLIFEAYAIILNVIMCAQGYLIGSITNDLETANQINSFSIILFMLVSGGLGSLADFPEFITVFSYLSP